MKVKRPDMFKGSDVLGWGDKQPAGRERLMFGTLGLSALVQTLWCSFMARTPTRPVNLNPLDEACSYCISLKVTMF